MARYRFITCNIRVESPEDGENQFHLRVDRLCAALNALAPDVIGIQEMIPAMRRQMMARLPGYGFLGGGRDAARLGESPAIVFRQDRLMPERLDTFMLSPEPYTPGTTFGGDQSGCPRAFCTAEFMPLDGGKPFRFMNVHTDHVGANARQLAVVQMLQELSRQQALRPMETVITGDFNATPDSPEMQPFYRYRDGALTDAAARLPGTFHQFGQLDPPEKIDYIWLTRGWRTVEAELVLSRTDEGFLSDHHPIAVTVEEV